jgi:hypothetical protein
MDGRETRVKLTDNNMSRIGTVVDERSELVSYSKKELIFVFTDEMNFQTQMMPLHKACQYGHVRCVEELLKLGGESQILEQNAVILCLTIVIV